MLYCLNLNMDDLVFFIKIFNCMPWISVTSLIKLKNINAKNIFAGQSANSKVALYAAA